MNSTLLKFIKKMEIIKIIKSKTQYKNYCNQLELLLCKKSKSKQEQDKIELLTLLIEKWDTDNSFSIDLEPIPFLHSLMDENNLKAKDLVNILGISKGNISEILHFQKGLSKEVIRKLSSYFKVNQEAFNRPYKLKVSANSHYRNASVMNTKKEFV
jgi:HTH-type transcriptional regulator / antitoxin HigA